MRLLFVPDSLWGNESGHRSATYLIKAFSSVNVEVAVYAPVTGYNSNLHKIVGDSGCKFFPQTAYRYYQNFFPNRIYAEFKLVIDEFKPDLVLYMGTIKNKISIGYCIKNSIQYFYLPLTNEYFCIKTFAGVKSGPCYGCIRGSLIAPFYKKCLPENFGIAKYVKEKLIERISRHRVLSAKKIITYGDSQISVFERYGVDRHRILTLPVFFDPTTANTVNPSVGDRFFIFGQLLTAKGWHLVPDIIRKTCGVKFTAVIKRSESDAFIKNNKLEGFIENGALEVIDYFDTHDLLIKKLAMAKGVLIPSYYHTTGEFTMIESLMLGKPVVVFDVGIHKEIFVDRVNGMMASVGDLSGYCKRIEQLNSDEELHNIVSRGGIELFKRLTSFGKFSSIVGDLLDMTN